MTARLVIAGLVGGSAVLLGAFGAHGLRGKVSDALLTTWQTAAHYHLVHAVALLALALYAHATDKTVAWPFGLFLAGVAVFSGSLYALVLTGTRAFGAVTPVGGLLLIAGWLAVAFWLGRH